MSQSNKGFGKGRGRVGKSSKDTKSCPSVSSETKSSMVPSGSTSSSFPSTMPSESSRSINIPQSSQQPGEASSVRKLKSDLEKLTLERKVEGERGSEGTIRRGGISGRRLIRVEDVIKTKPETTISKKGDFGKAVSLQANYFKLESVTDWVLYQYRVDFSVQEEREKVLRSWLRQHKDRLNTAYIFDGSMLFTSQRLTAQNEPLSLTSIREDDSLVKINIKLIQQLKYGNAVYLQVFNILVRRCMMLLNLHMVSGNYYDPKASLHLRQYNMEIWPGYVTSIRQHENSILMCCDISHKIMRNDTALHVLKECTIERGDYKYLYQQSMIGAVVLTDYNNKTYRIDDVDFSMNPLSTFEYKNSEIITFVEYYQRRYQIKIKDLNQPLLISRSSARDLRAGKGKQCLLVPELCRMTGLTNKMLENRNLMKNLSEITRIPPDVRIERLISFGKRLTNEKQVIEDFSRWQMKLSPKLITVCGRELPPENIIGGKSVTYFGEGNDWTRNMRCSPMLKNGRFDCFVVICPVRLKKDTENFLSALNRSAKGMSFSIPQPVFFDTKTDRPAEMLEAIEMALGRCRPDLILFTFTSNHVDRYSAVKKKCYVDRGIPSQVVLARSLTSKGIMSIATKVAVQINSKIGGAPWAVHIPSEHVMVVGFDVHLNKWRKSKSVGAVVASLNQAMSTWFSTVCFHSNGEELSNSLPLDICNAVRKYREVNSNVLPTRIIVYRDGVGEGQINHVYNHEVVLLKKRLTELYGGENWKLAYIIVTKHIKTRFFDGGRNPRPGTIVDDVVTLPERYDFYLVSQSVREGTVSPTNYNVISDNLGWAPNHVQRFTYKMTHLYFNCSASVRVPAPCQYAHKLAFLVGQFLQAQPHPNLETTLYFL